MTDSFLNFYRETSARLKKKAADYNRALSGEPNALLAPIRADMADLNEGGKYLRGVLVALGYRIAAENCLKDGGEPRVSADDSCPADPCAAEVSDALSLAVEIFQTGVLIHDDIIDRAELRRGKKTIHARYAEHLAEMRGADIRAGADTHAAESAAICAGDYLICEANRYLAESYRSHPRLAELILEFDGIVLDTIRGELLDVILPYEMEDPKRSREDADRLLSESVFEIYRLKTARYSVVGPLRLGMILGGAGEEEMTALDSFAMDLGVAFQIKDDLLGIYADEQTMGKDAGSDIAECKQTLLYAYLRKKGGAELGELMRHYGKTPVTAGSIRAVQEIFASSGAKKYAEGAMEECFARAEQKLEKMGFLSDEDRAALAGFIDYSRSRGH